MALDLSAISRPIGPLPLWAWGAMLGGGAILFASTRGHPAAKAIVDPNTPTPSAPGDPGGGVASPPSQVLEPGQTVGNPVSLSDLLGGQTFADFLHTLGPNYTQATINAGSLGASVQNSAQNILDEQSVLAQYHAAEVNNTNFYNTVSTWWQNYFAATGQAPWWMPTQPTNPTVPTSPTTTGIRF